MNDKYMQWLMVNFRFYRTSGLTLLMLSFFVLIAHTGLPQSPCYNDLKPYSQASNIDREKKVTRYLQQLDIYAAEDSLKLKTIIFLAEEYINIRYDSAVYYLEKAILLAEKIQSRTDEVTAFIKRGMAEEVCKHNWDEAQAYYRQAYEKARKYKLVSRFDELYSIMHNAFYYQGNFPQAMQIANEGLKRAEMNHDQLQQLHYTLLIAAAYLNQELNEQALSAYLKAERIASYPGFNENAAKNLVYIADVYYGMGNTYKAKGDTSRALYYLDKALQKFSLYQYSESFIRSYMLANVYWSKGIVYAGMQHYDSAARYAELAMQQCRQYACNLYEKVNYYLLAGEAAGEMGKHVQAREYFMIANCIAIFNNHAENKRDVAYHLSNLFAKEEKFDSAWVYNRRYIQLKDSISNERSRYRTQEINTIYQLAEKDSKIARQNNLRNLLIFVFVLSLLLMVFLYSRYRLRQKNRYQQELNRQQNELFNAIAHTQDQERKRIAQDLHDGLGSVLSAARLKLAEIKDNRPELISDEKFMTGISLLDEASVELRNISHNIMPATLSKLGLVPALKNLFGKFFSHKGLQISFIAHDVETRLDEQTEISIYRIILELINNVVKHSGATKATVQLVQYPDYINITVEDNGQGFDKTKISEDRTGMGLGNVAARVGYLRGKIEIDSEPGKGTTVIVDIPVT